MLNPKAKVCRMHSRDELSELGGEKKTILLHFHEDRAHLGSWTQTEDYKMIFTARVGTTLYLRYKQQHHHISVYVQQYKKFTWAGLNFTTSDKQLSAWFSNILQGESSGFTSDLLPFLLSKLSDQGMNSNKRKNPLLIPFLKWHVWRRSQVSNSAWWLGGEKGAALADGVELWTLLYL